MRLATLLLVACATPPPEQPAGPLAWTVVLDRTCSAAEVASVVEGARAWELELADACPIAVSFSESDVDELDAPLPWIERHVEVRCGEVPDGFDGYARWNGAGFARFSISASSLPRTVRHELGHAFRLRHATSGIMADPAGPSIERSDVDAFVATWCGKTNGETP